ncbi:protein kinase [Stenotrophomonas maltophilia]|nr:protein kinase [Stenotrophomonas maltophilia]MBH1602005.1 protein kinase [Stenotrophomonas maltophilia]
MQEDTTSVVELVTAFSRGALDLPALLRALARHDHVADADYRNGVDTLWRMRQQQAIDEVSMNTLLQRLQDLRDASGSPVSRDDDVTVVKPARSAVPDDVTHVQPGADVARTGSAAEGRTSGTASQSSSLSAWQQVAAAVGQTVTVGSLLKGRFQLERELGRGGMGVVYLARDARKVEARDRDPWLAVKVLSDEFRRHPDALVALQREARRSQQLGHDNIVRVYDFDKDGAIVFMTMEYVDGQDLRTLIREQAFDGMPMARAWPLIEGMASALRRAHASGIVHSDFKPGNVMVTAQGVPKVFDFGIARAGKHAVDVAGEQTVFDAASLGALTPAYASLEMLRGQPPTPADDVYALGCVCFELLGGRHPYDKASAEVALREGRRPPALRGLGRRQYRALCAAVSLPAGKRLANVDALVEGLRPRSWRERVLPRVGYAAAAAAVLAGAGVLANRHVHEQRMAEVSARLGADDPQRYEDAAQAWDGLSSLDHEQRAKLLLDRPGLVEGFLLRRLDALWAPSAGRYDYPGTQEVFALRDRLRLYSPTLDVRRDRLQAERDQALNGLDTQRQQRIADGDLFGHGNGSLSAALAAIAAIDPRNPLLRDPALEQAYEQAIAGALEQGDTAQAESRLQQAQRSFPDSLGLRLQAAQLRVASQPDLQATALPATVGQARERLQQRLARPSADPTWQTDVAAALQVIRRDASSELPMAQNALATAVAATLGGQREPAQLPDDLVLLDFARRQAPDTAALAAVAGQLQQRQLALQQSLADSRSDAALAAQSESLRRAIAAGDLDKAQRSWQQLHALQPDAPFVREQAPALLDLATQDQAVLRLAQGDPAAADAVLARALQVMGARPALQAARARLEVVAAVLAASATTSARDSERLRQQLDVQYRRDPQAMERVEKALRTHGRLKGDSLQSLLQAEKSAVATAPPPTAGSAAAAGSAHSPRNAARPSMAAPVTSAAIAGDDAALPPVPDGPDPCAGLAGRGQPCYDALADARGPMLVVVPGVSGGPAYALSRGEIAVDDFNRYCRASGHCSVQPVAGEQGRWPARNLTLAQAQGYARWLTRASGGWRYRLPSDAEWLHAAQAQQQWRQAPDSNCIPPSASVGGGTPVGVRGREPNPWGLVNMTGNVWEWTGSGSARGGSYASFWSDCTVQAQRALAGAAQPDVGFRVLRELK